MAPYCRQVRRLSWANLYAGSSIEEKKMILRQLMEQVNTGKNFETDRHPFPSEEAEKDA